MQQAQITLTPTRLSIFAHGEELKKILEQIPEEEVIEISILDGRGVAADLSAAGFTVALERDDAEKAADKKPKAPKKPRESSGPKLTKKKRGTIIKRHNDGDDAQTISEDMGFSVERIQQVIAEG